MISSIENPKIKLLMKLKQGKYRKKEEMFIVEGAHLVKEAKLAGVLIEAYSIIEQDGFELVSESVMKKISTTDTVVREIGLCKFINKEKLGNKILILDGVQDPGNMGTLMRSACAFGYETIFVGNGSVDIYNEKVIRSSQGAIFKLNFKFGNVVDFINEELGSYKVYGTNVVRGVALDEVSNLDKMAVILGNEGNGISKEVDNLLLDKYVFDNNTLSTEIKAVWCENENNND